LGTASIRLLVAAALTVPLLTATPAVAQAASQQNPQLFAGTVVTAGGTRIAGQLVSLYVTPDRPDKSTLIGTAVTNSRGQWSLAAPAYAALPKAAQLAATADMGYLNVEAVAMHGSAIAIATESAWVGTPVLTRETSGLASTIPVAAGHCGSKARTSSRTTDPASTKPSGGTTPAASTSYRRTATSR
jgi:hypothetical protein